MNIARPYQKIGAEFLAARKTALLADEPGLGKTIQSILAINHLGAKKVLIICPATLKINWYRELSKWLTRPKIIHIIEASKPIPEADIYIVNYDIVIRQSIKDFLNAKRFAVLICDESHMLKNLKAKRTKAVLSAKGLIHTAVYKWMLTGTPVLNRPVELFPILLTLGKKYIAPYDKFYAYAKHFCAAYMSDFGLDTRGASNLDELNRRLKPFMLRRLKADVEKDLPARQYQIVELDCEKPMPVLADAENLGQIATFRKQIADIKFDMVCAHIDILLEGESKLIVFAHHRHVIDNLMRRYEQTHHAVALYGGMTAESKQKAVDKFQQLGHVKLFIGQIQAAGVGITLTAASNIVFAEMSWSPEEMRQCIDRAHRIGQSKPVLAQFLVVKDSLEANMLDAIMKKITVIQKILS